VVGHGLRLRQVRGCLDAESGPRVTLVLVRRYRCRACRAVITVLPSGTVARRHFGAGTIGLALALFGERASPVRAIRERLGGVGPPESRSWVTLRRWAVSAQTGTLFPRLRAVPESESRKRAARAAEVLASYAMPASARAPLHQQVFEGAVRLARAA
jgi:hypothetical protein